jgi:hypothetical protein
MRRFAVLLAALALVLGASAALAETGIGFKGIGGHLDYVDPENIDAVLGFGGLVDLGTITPEIGLEGNLDFWSKSMDFLNWSATTRVISIGATGKYYFAVNNKAWRPFAGAGLAVHLLHGSVDYNAGYLPYLSGSASSDDTKFGIDLCGGTLYGLNNKFDLLGELRYRLVSDVNQIVLRAGVVYRLGQ